LLGRPAGAAKRAKPYGKEKPMTAWGLAALLLWSGAAPAETSLEARLAPLAKAHKGQVAIAVKHLDTGASYDLRADAVMPTASLIKLPVMVEVYQQVAEGKVKLSDMVTLHDADKVPGSGILTYHFSEGATFCLRDAVRLMIAYSDNTATNLILDRISIPATTRRMIAWGLPNTRLNAKVFKGDTTSVDPERTKKYGLGSTTAHEMVALLERLHRGKVVSPAASREMIEHLKQCQDKDKIKRFLPADLVVAHKSGAVKDIRTDAGILYLPGGPVALCVLTAQNEDQRWAKDNAGEVLIGRVAQEVYQYFTAVAGKRPAGQ
jgi:beta-lactamase class A